MGQRIFASDSVEHSHGGILPDRWAGEGDAQKDDGGWRQSGLILSSCRYSLDSMLTNLRTRAAIVDRFLAGEPTHETADDFGLSVAETQSIVDAVPQPIRKLFADNEFVLEDGQLYFFPFSSKMSAEFLREIAADQDDGSALLTIADFLDAENLPDRWAGDRNTQDEYDRKSGDAGEED